VCESDLKTIQSGGDGLTEVGPQTLRQLKAVVIRHLDEIVALLGDRDNDVDLLGDGRTPWDEAQLRLRQALSNLQAQPAADSDCLLIKFDCFRAVADALGTQHGCVTELAFSLVYESERFLQAGLLHQSAHTFLRSSSKAFSLPRLFPRLDGSRSARSNGHSHG
jgi:hypothetical protein